MNRSQGKRRDVFRIRAPDPGRHGAAIAGLAAKAFAGPVEYFSFLTEQRERLEKGLDHYAADASRVGFMGEWLLTHCGIYDYRMRIGSARVRVAGVGMVCTHGEYRKRGFMARTFKSCMKAAQDLGYDMSLLFGISDFYGKFGFVPAWPELAWIVDANDLPRGKPAFLTRKGSAHGVNRMAAHHNREHAKLTGSAVRPFRSIMLPDSTHIIRTWTHQDGQAAGYVVVAPRGEVLEWIDSVGDVLQILRVLKTLAEQNRCRKVRFPHLHHTHKLCKILRRGNCQLEQDYRRDGGPMARVLSLSSALEKMKTELHKRLSGSGFSNWSGRLLIIGAGEKLTLEIKRSRVEVAEPVETKHILKAGDGVAQLLIGTDDPVVLAEGSGMRLQGDARALLPILFPRQHPDLNRLDRF